MRFNSALKTAERIEYPVTYDELLTLCGDITIDCPNGEDEKLADIMQITPDSPNEFGSFEEFRDYVYSLAPQGFIGRQFYCDRGSTKSNTDELTF